VRLSCTARPEAAGANAAIYFDDFSLAQLLSGLPHPKGDPEQDELWLRSGDQVFGKVTSATLYEIHMHGSYGSRPFRWGDVRGIYFQQPAATKVPVGGNRVRIWLRSGIAGELDVLNGTVRRLDARHLILVHDQLGLLEIDRRWLRRVQSLAGERLPNGR
jgi:hypothetical protein